jgi:hypothetical protein
MLGTFKKIIGAKIKNKNHACALRTYSKKQKED